ncbi:MAG: toll/interleukin-1 receptor domain-containing protein [Blastocatellia bacterium]
MAEAYEYDVFVSYRRKQPVMDWVNNHFYPLLDQRLPDEMPVEHETKIFIDFDEIETGAAWPAKLREALRKSRCIVAVWSPEYFRSEWCMAEWRTFVEREKLLGLPADRQRLIYPVVFADGEHFPPDAKETQYRDLKKWNLPHLPFRNSLEFLDFDKEVQAVANELAAMIQKAPAWNDWPIITPNVDKRVLLQGARL